MAAYAIRMNSTWKWDWQHIVIVIAFLAGLAWSTLGVLMPLIAAGHLTLTSIVPMLLVVVPAVFGFFKNPPSNPEQALQEGEAAAAGQGIQGKRGFAQVKVLFALSMAGILVLAAGCTKSQWDQLVQTVKTDLENGALLSSLEAVVASLFPQFASDASVIDSILQAVVNLLQSSGSLSQTGQARAIALQAEIRGKLQNMGAPKCALPPDAERVIAELRGMVPMSRPTARLVAAVGGRIVR